MKNEKLSSTVLSETEVPQSRGEDVNSNWQRVVRRRSFLKGLSIASGTVTASALLTALEALVPGGMTVQGQGTTTAIAFFI